MHKHAALTLTNEARQQAIISLRAYSTEHFDSELSELQATMLLDHFLTDLAPSIYNQAALDARRFVEDRAADIEAALHKSEFPISSRRAR